MYLNVEIELYEENGKQMVFLAHDGSSGCKYEYATNSELKRIISAYIADIIDNMEEQ